MISNRINEFINSQKTQLVFSNYLTLEETHEVYNLAKQYNLQFFTRLEGLVKHTVVRKHNFKNSYTFSKIYCTPTPGVTPKDVEIFRKAFNLPIPILDPTYLQYFCQLYDSMYDSVRKYNVFKLSIDKHQFRFYKFHTDIQNKMIDMIIKTSGYDRLQKFNFSSNQLDTLPRKMLYDSAPKQWEYYISLDIIKANITVAYRFDNTVLNGASSWDEFVEKFTNEPFFKEDKHLRQTVVGKMSVGKFVGLERIEMKKMQDTVNKLFSDRQIFALNNDEIIISSSEENWKNDINMLNLNTTLLPSSEIWRKIPIRIKRMEDCIGCLRENLITNYVEIKCVPKQFFPQVYKHYKKIPIEKPDLKFSIDTQTATFDEPMFVY